MENFRHKFHNAHRHIAYIEDSCVWTQNFKRLSNDCRRIGIVDYPIFLTCVFFAEVNYLCHWVNCAQTVCKSAGAAGFLTDNMVFKRNLFVFFTHFEKSDSHLCKYEVCIGKCFLRLCRKHQFKSGLKFINYLFHNNTDCILAFLEIIIKAEFAKWKLIFLAEYTCNYTGRICTSASNNNQFKFLHKYYSFI